MNAAAKTWITVAVSVIAGGAIAAAGVWAVSSSRIARLEESVETLRAEKAESRKIIEGLTGRLEAASQALTSSAPSAATTTPPPPKKGSTAEDGRNFGYIKSAKWEAGPALLTVDYAELLSGDDAAKAAAAAGEESPPPNDYFISNKNKKLRTFPVSASVKVRMTTTEEGTEPEGYSMTFSAWYDAYSGMSGALSDRVKVLPYWITVKDGVITKIEEQYLP